MTHQDQAAEAAKLLCEINGVDGCCVRGRTVIPQTVMEIHEEAHRKFVMGGPERERWIALREKEATAIIAEQASPFPHVLEGTVDGLENYLVKLTDMLAPGDDPRIDARIGETRLVAEEWDSLVIAISIRVCHPGNKSLSRRLRAVRRKVS